MIEELPSRRLAYRFTHELVRRALYDRLSAVRRAEMHLRVGEALERSEGRSGRALADLAHHFAAAAPLDGAAARHRVQRRGRAGSRRRGRVRRGGDPAAHRAGAGIESRASARGGVPRARHRQPPRRRCGRRARGVQGDGGHRPRARGRQSCSRAPRSATRRRAGARGSPTGARSSCSRRRRPRWATTTPSCARGCSAGSRADSSSKASTSAAPSSAPTPSPWPASCAIRCRLATVLVRSYWSRGTSSLDEILAMLTEAVDLGEELGDTEILAEAMAWRVPTFVALGDLESARREVAALLATAEQTAQPFILHVAEHYGSTHRAVRRAPRRGRGQGAALARVEPAAERERRRRRLRHPDVQHPPRAGTSGGARAGDPDPGRRRRPRRAVAARPRLRARRARHGHARRGASSRAWSTTGSTRSASRCGSPRSST